MRTAAALLVAGMLALAPLGIAAREDARTRKERRVARLFEMLANPRATYRAKAAEVLGKLAVDEAEEKLVAALSDPDERVRAAAAGGLGSMRARGAVDPLTGSLSDPVGEVRIASIIALGRIGDPRPAKAVTALLTEDPAVWLPIAEALGSMGDKSAIAALKRIHDAFRTGPEQCRVAAALGKLQPSLGLELVTRHAKARDAATVFAAFQAAGEMNHAASARWLLERFQKLPTFYDVAGPELLRDAFAAAIGALRDEKLLRPFLQDAAREKRSPDKPSDKLVTVLRGIAHGAHPRFHGEVFPFVKDAEMDVQLAAIRALGRIRDPRAADVILPLLAHADYMVVIAAADACGDLELDAAIDPLLARLQDPDFRIRHAAARALARVRCEDIVEPLIACLETSGDWLTKEIAAVLKDITNMDLLTGAAGWRGWWEKNRAEFRIQYEEDHAR